MNTLHLIFPPPGHHDQFLNAAAEAAPSLLKLLNRGETATPETSLAGTLCKAFGIKQQQDWPLAPICAMTDGMNAASGYWLRLDPVHLEVVMGGLLLRPPASLLLSQSEASALIADINLHWQREGLEIQAASPTRWYLHLPESPNLHTSPLDQMVGEYLTAGLPRGADARHYLKLINEVQMLMHSHPVNVARETAGNPAVNGLWFWGGGTLPTCKTQLDLAAGDVFEIEALSQRAGCSFIAPPNAISDLKISNHALVVLPSIEVSGHTEIGAYLAQLEQNWFQPLLHQLAWGRIKRARLDLLGQKTVKLTPSQTWRFWR
jgi:hypothetical protein